MATAVLFREVKDCRKAALPWIELASRNNDPADGDGPRFKKAYLAGAIINLREGGLTYREIGNRLQISRQFVLNTLKEHRPDLMGDLFEAFFPLVIALRLEGWAYRETSDELGFTESRVRKAIRKSRPDLPKTNPRDVDLKNPEVVESCWFEEVARREYPETTAKYVDRYEVLKMHARHGLAIREVAELEGTRYLTVYRWVLSLIFGSWMQESRMEG